MKKVLKMSVLLLATAFFASCSSDDDGNSISGNLEAKWTPTKTVYKVGGQSSSETYQDNEPGCDKDYLQFLADGTVKNAVYYKNASNVCTEDSATDGNWAKDGSSLIITNSSEYDGEYTIRKLNGSELQVQTTQTIAGVAATVTLYFQKVE
ncbi:lipocalin family protein [Flavobacterium sp. HJ-32-4]|uniref:lipocalin family protein n=1 Tax=Flavobacterium sp. HJ-32-4 TaxID=1160795 RepID=UPI001F12B886|nr:lipocalin family protein [Flavobacterium sp. HJ-32-4]UMY65256.1 lipocalin family protein [Flavobacterium sp. HJ-32-4]